MGHIEQAAARQAEQAIAQAAIRASFPDLLTIDKSGGNYLTTATKNIRRQLAAKFPGVKFSVTSSRYSGGSSIDVRWTDGPTHDQVDPIANRHQYGNFDGMTDCYDFNDGAARAFTDSFGGAQFVFCNREYTDATIARILARLYRYWCDPETPAPTVADYRSGNLYRIQSRSSDFSREVHRALSKHTFCL